MTLHERLFIAPVTEHPQHILDIGTGTGIWAMDAGEKTSPADKNAY